MDKTQQRTDSSVELNGEVEQTAQPAAPPVKKINPALLIFLIFPLMGITAALALAGQSGRVSSQDGVQPLAVGYTPQFNIVNNPAPDFKLNTPAGQPIQLSSLRGKWIFLNFWATWCPPCQRELPNFQKLLNGGFGPVQDKVTVLAVDNGETGQQVQSYLDGLKITVPAVVDSDGTAVRMYGVVQIPMTFLIDPQGVVRYEQLGEVTPDVMRQILQKYLNIT